MASRSLGTLTLDLLASIGRVQEDMTRVSTSIAGAGAAASAAATQVGAMQGQFQSLSSVAAGLTKPLADAFSVKALYSAVETYSVLTNRLKLVTNGAAELAAAQGAVFSIAQASAQPLATTAALYQRIAANQDALKLSGEGVAGIVGTVSKTFAISGVSAQTASSALGLLGQAFDGGVLKGEALTSLMAQVPSLTDAIAQGMGKSVSELSAMGSTGELTAERVVKAIQSQAGAVDALYGKTSLTVGDNLARAGNSLTQFIGQLDQMSGASAGASSVLGGIVDGFDANLPTVLDAAREHSDALSQALTTGLYVALGRVVGGYAAVIPVTAARIKAAAEEAKANQVAASAATRKAEVDLVSAKNAVEAARMNKQLASSSSEVAAADRALAAAKSNALQMSERLGVARAAEANANDMVARTSTASGVAGSVMSRSLQATAGAGRAMLGMMGGPVGLLFMVGATALSFIDFRSHSEKAREGLEQLTGPMDQVIARFKSMTAEQQAGALVRWGEAQADAVKAAQGELDTLQSTLKKGLLGSDSLALQARVGGSGPSSKEFIAKAKAFEQYRDRIDEAAKSGQSIMPIINELERMPGVSPKLIDDLKKQAEAWSNQNELAKQSGDRQKALRDQMAETAAAAAASAGNTDGMTEAGRARVKAMDDQLGKLQDNNDVVKEANRYIEEHKDLSDADKAAILSKAKAIKAQDEANRAAVNSTRSLINETRSVGKTFADAQQDYQRQIDLIDETINKRKEASEVEKLASELSSGKFEALNGQQRKELEDLAAKLDAQKQLVKAKEDEKKLASLKSGLAEENTSAQRDFGQELAGIGKGDKTRKRMEELFAIEQEFNGKRLDAQKQYEEEKAAGAPNFEENYAKETEVLNEALEARLETQYGYYELLDEMQGDWMNGVTEAWENFATQAQDYSTQTAELVGGALGSATSELGAAIKDVATGSKTLGEATTDMISGFANSMISALADMAAQWLVYQAVQLMVGKATQSSAGLGMVANAQATSFQAQIAAYASTAAIPVVGPAMAPAAAATAAMATAPMVAGVASSALMGMAHAGIDTIPREGTWLLDGGERVLSPNQNRDLTHYLASANGDSFAGLGSGGLTINAPVSVQAQPGMSDEAAWRQGEMMAEGLKQTIRQVVNEEFRQGGTMWRR